MLILLIGCSPSQTYLGHWKCDESGTITVFSKNGESESKPITEFYSAFNSEPTEFEISNDGMFTFYNGDEGEALYFPNYQNDPLKLLLRTNNGNDDNIVTFKYISADKMKMKLETLENKMVFDLTLNKVN